MEARTPPPLQQDGLDESYLTLVAQLREKVAERPDDLAGLRLLYQHESNIGNYRGARDAIVRVIELSGDAASAMDHANFAEMLVLSAGGYVSPEAEEQLAQSLQLDPRNGIARYYSGAMFTQIGRPDRAFRIWSQLLAESTPEAPWQQAIRAQIDEVAMRAGVDDYAPPPLGAAPMLPGPSGEDMDAAAAMTPAERIEMIEGMVAGLADRLANDGGPPEEWARLIRAYGVLGRTEDAATIWAEAQNAFPDDETRVPILQAARDAGVAE
jgi:cytochrome c-type biogenesis protein CcmH